MRELCGGNNLIEYFLCAMLYATLQQHHYHHPHYKAPFRSFRAQNTLPESAILTTIIKNPNTRLYYNTIFAMMLSFVRFVVTFSKWMCVCIQLQLLYIHFMFGCFTFSRQFVYSKHTNSININILLHFMEKIPDIRKTLFVCKCASFFCSLNLCARVCVYVWDTRINIGM